MSATIRRRNAILDAIRDGYDFIFEHDGYTLILDVDEEPYENRKYFYKIIAPDGIVKLVPGFTYKRMTRQDFIDNIHKIFD